MASWTVSQDLIIDGDGSDVLDGGPGTNRLGGGSGVDLASFAFSLAPVAVDLSGTTDTATRGGGEIDLLTSIEGAIGSGLTPCSWTGERARIRRPCGR